MRRLASTDEADSTGEPTGGSVGPRPAIHRMAASIGLAVIPFGLAFGFTANEAGLAWWEALGFSLMVFAGGAQFAAVQVLGQGGAVFSAVLAGALLNLRSLAYGVVMAPALKGPFWRRALESQLMIDESMAVGTAQVDDRWRRYGYVAGGLSVFVTWNISTLVGALIFSGGTLVTDFGLDAAIPAALLAMLWPRLKDPVQRLCALAGAAIAFAGVPFLPAGLPIVAACGGIAAARLAGSKKSPGGAPRP